MIFISYRKSDSEDFVSRLDNDLTAEFGQENVFRDFSRLKGGEVWTDVLESNAINRKVMLAVIGDKWQVADETSGEWKGFPRLMNPDDWVRKELTLAFESGTTIIPILRNGAAMPSAAWLKKCGLEWLYEHQAIEIRASQYSTDLGNLINRLRSLLPDLPSSSPPVPTEIIISRRLPPSPPAYFAEIEYILTDTFIGRATELDLLDEWAKSNDSLMVVEGLGGLGKSALTWEWFQKRAAYSIPNLAGRVWCDFYGPNATLIGSLRNIFAYIFREYPPIEFSVQELAKAILQELRRRPFLLVWDGFERMLAAYHHWDKAQKRDDNIDSAKRACVDPKDTEVLKQFLSCSPSKVLVSTRLFPSALEDRSGRYCRGVVHHHLNGLSRADTLAYFRHIGIRGDESKMLDFAKKFGNHSLVLKVICGDIGNYFRKPGDFDAWLSDPEHGGKIRLSELDLKQNYTHILEFALKGLDEGKQKLLSRLAILSEHLDYDTVFIINPYLPARPTGMSLKDFLQSKDVRESRQLFEKALWELADRGLVQWDRQTGHFDMHPVVRGHAADFIQEEERQSTFLTVRDHFQAMPTEEQKEASELSQIRHSIEIYRSCLGAGLWDEAASYFEKGEFANSLMWRIGAFPLIEELLRPLLESDANGQPRLKDSRIRSKILISLAIALDFQSRQDESLALYEQSLRINIDLKRWGLVATSLSNWGSSRVACSQLAVANAAFSLAKKISAKAEDEEGLSILMLKEAEIAIAAGRFEDGEQHLRVFQARPIPNYSAYRPGRAERMRCFNQFQQDLWNVDYWHLALEIARNAKNIIDQHRLFALRGAWLMSQDLPHEALEFFDEALKLANRSGTQVPEYHDLRGWGFAALGRPEEAIDEFSQGEQREVAGMGWMKLGDVSTAKECALNGYRDAWGDGPPFSMWYRLEQCRKLLLELGLAEPQLSPFDPSKRQPLPFEAELCDLLPNMEPSLASRMFLLRGKDSTGRAAWYYLLVDKDKRNGVEQRFAKQVQLTEFGQVISSGYGTDPPDDERERMKDEFGFDD